MEPLTLEEKLRWAFLRKKPNKSKDELAEFVSLSKRLHLRRPNKLETDSKPIDLTGAAPNYPTASPNTEELQRNQERATDYINNLRDVNDLAFRALLLGTTLNDAIALAQMAGNSLKLPTFGASRASLDGLNNVTLRAVERSSLLPTEAYTEVVTKNLELAAPSLSIKEAVERGYGTKFDPNEAFYKFIGKDYTTALPTDFLKKLLETPLHFKFELENWAEYLLKQGVDLSKLSRLDLDRALVLREDYLNNAFKDGYIDNRYDPYTKIGDLKYIKEGYPLGYMNYEVLLSGNVMPTFIENLGTEHHVGLKLYSASNLIGESLGGLGTRSGDHLLRPAATTNTWKHFPNRELINTEGVHRDWIDVGSNTYHPRTTEGPVMLLKGVSEDAVPVKSNYFDPKMALNPDGTMNISYEMFNPTYSKGGSIHIKPENRDKFTALKERTGHSTSWFLENDTPALRKMANFARNAAKWKHADGGHLFDGLTESTQQMNDATRVAGPIYVPELGESKVVTGGTPMGDFGLWAGLMLLNTPRFVPFSLLLQGLGLYLQTDLPTEEELRLINLEKRKEALKNAREHPYASAFIAGLLGFAEGMNVGIWNEAFQSKNKRTNATNQNDVYLNALKSDTSITTAEKLEEMDLVYSGLLNKGYLNWTLEDWKLALDLIDHKFAIVAPNSATVIKGRPTRSYIGTANGGYSIINNVTNSSIGSASVPNVSTANPSHPIFTTPNYSVANSYAGVPLNEETKMFHPGNLFPSTNFIGGRPMVYPVYTNIENPKIINWGGNPWTIGPREYEGLQIPFKAYLPKYLYGERGNSLGVSRKPYEALTSLQFEAELKAHPEYKYYDFHLGDTLEYHIEKWDTPGNITEPYIERYSYPNNTSGISTYYKLHPEHHNDGLIIKNVADDVKGKTVTDELIPFESSLVKLSLPITFDDLGNPIPLRERFNFKLPDIRFGWTVPTAIGTATATLLNNSEALEQSHKNGGPLKKYSNLLMKQRFKNREHLFEDGGITELLYLQWKDLDSRRHNLTKEEAALWGNLARAARNYERALENSLRIQEQQDNSKNAEISRLMQLVNSAFQSAAEADDKLRGMPVLPLLGYTELKRLNTWLPAINAADLLASAVGLVTLSPIILGANTLTNGILFSDDLVNGRPYAKNLIGLGFDALGWLGKFDVLKSINIPWYRRVNTTNRRGLPVSRLEPVVTGDQLDTAADIGGKGYNVKDIYDDTVELYHTVKEGPYTKYTFEPFKANGGNLSLLELNTINNYKRRGNIPNVLYDKGGNLNKSISKVVPTPTYFGGTLPEVTVSKTLRGYMEPLTLDSELTDLLEKDKSIYLKLHPGATEQDWLNAYNGLHNSLLNAIKGSTIMGQTIMGGEYSALPYGFGLVDIATGAGAIEDMARGITRSAIPTARAARYKKGINLESMKDIPTIYYPNLRNEGSGGKRGMIFKDILFDLDPEVIKLRKELKGLSEERQTHVDPFSQVYDDTSGTIDFPDKASELAFKKALEEYEANPEYHVNEYSRLGREIDRLIERLEILESDPKFYILAAEAPDFTGKPSSEIINFVETHPEYVIDTWKGTNKQNILNGFKGEHPTTDVLKLDMNTYLKWYNEDVYPRIIKSSTDAGEFKSIDKLLLAFDNLVVKIIDVPKTDLGGWANSNEVKIIANAFGLDPSTFVHELHHYLRTKLENPIFRSASGEQLLLLEALNAFNDIPNTQGTGYTNKEANLLDKAYEFLSDYIFNKKISPIREKGATNTELRYNIAKAYAKDGVPIKGKELDKIIDNLSDEDLFNFMFRTDEQGNSYPMNGYMRNFIDNQYTGFKATLPEERFLYKTPITLKYMKDRFPAIKDALKYVGGIGSPIVLSDIVNNDLKEGGTDLFENGGTLKTSLSDIERNNINNNKLRGLTPQVLYSKGGHLFDGNTEQSQLRYSKEDALTNWQSAFMHYGKDHAITQGWKKYYDALNNEGNKLPEVTVSAYKPSHVMRNIKNQVTDYIKEDPIQAALDVTGFIPGVDTFSDIGLVGYDLSKGNWGDAAISGLAALLPIASASELKNLKKGLNATTDIATDVVRPRRPRIGERRSGVIEDPLLKRKEDIKTANSASPTATSIDEVVQKLSGTTDGGKNIIGQSIDRSLLRDNSYTAVDAYLEFSGPFGNNMYLFGKTPLSPLYIQGKFDWKYADEFKEFKRLMAEKRGITLSKPDYTLDNATSRYWYKSPDSYQQAVSSPKYIGNPSEAKSIILDSSLDKGSLFNTGNGRLAHGRYKNLVEYNPSLKRSLDNTGVETWHLKPNGYRTFKENIYGHENLTYSLGLEMLMQMYNLLRDQLQRPISVEEFNEFISKLPLDFIDNYVKNIHGKRYRILDHSIDGEGVKRLMRLFGTSTAVGTGAYMANQSLDSEYRNGGRLNKYSKGTEHDLSSVEVFDLIKKGYKISYI